MNKLFSSLTLNSNVSIKNRLAVAPMTTQQSNPDGSLSAAESSWLERLSADGYGLVISCAASVSDTATAFYNQLSLGHDDVIPALQVLSKNMKANGSINLIQLCHAGSRAIESLTGEKPHSASSYPLPGVPNFVPPIELSQEQIKQIVKDFADACVRAEKAGFDGVELHGANGYLFTQFISTMTNIRKDEYGGSIENRARFAREVVRACRKKVSKDFVIGFRLSFEGMGMETGLDIDENIQIANWLVEDGISYIHSSQMNYAADTAKYPAKKTTEYIRQNITKELPLVIAGSITSVEDAEKALKMGADIVATGRAVIANKHLPDSFKRRESLSQHTPFTEKQLEETGISPAFIDYLKNAPPLRNLHIVQS